MLLEVLLIVARHRALSGRLNVGAVCAVVAVVVIIIVIRLTTLAGKALVMRLDRGHILHHGETHGSALLLKTIQISCVSHNSLDDLRWGQRAVLIAFSTIVNWEAETLWLQGANEQAFDLAVARPVPWRNKRDLQNEVQYVPFQ